MHWDGTITLGTLISALVMLVGIAAVFIRMGSLQELVKTHGTALERGTARMDKHDALLLELVGDVRELIGRSRKTAESDS
jgi:hypothetical protein